MDNQRFDLDGITYDLDNHTRRGTRLTIGRDGQSLDRITVNLHDLRSRTQAVEALKAVDQTIDWWSHLRQIATHVNEPTGNAGGFGHDPVEPHLARGRWPADATEEAFYGLAGDIARTIEPHTEADPHALLTNTLVAFGNSVGPGPHFKVGQDMHGLRLDAVLVGESAHGRKGLSWAESKSIFQLADPEFGERVTTGLSSGEGLIWAVRDPIFKTEPIKEKGRVVDYQQVLQDPGVTDKRKLVIEPEFARTLKVMSRDGNILSAVIRQAWDTGDLRVMTKSTPAQATGAHISIMGHITREELLRHLDSTEAANGFGNRFLWMAVRRNKCLPEGGSIPDVELERLSQRLGEALRFGSSVSLISMDDEARAAWHGVYPELSRGKPGLFGALTARAEAQVTRLASIYAVMDKSSVIKPEYLLAALAFWERTEATVRYLFGDATGDPLADKILWALRTQGNMTDTEIYSDLFGRHQKSERIAQALGLLLEASLVEFERVETAGRPSTLWRPNAAGLNAPSALNAHTSGGEGES